MPTPVNWSIYTLKHPRTNEIRYIGWTNTPVATRLRNHVMESVKSQNTHKQRWVFSLVKIGLHPAIEVIESGSGDGWAAAERRWIAFHRANGTRLVNGTDGGDGSPGWGTPELRRARSLKSNASQTPEQRSARSKKAHASQTPEERSARQVKAWINRGLEKASAHMDLIRAKRTKDSFRRSGIGRWANVTPEARTIANRCAALTGTHEERSERAKKATAHLTHEDRVALGRLAGAASAALAAAKRASAKVNQLSFDF